MSDESAFIRAIQADSANDASRLVYADWLDEHGKPAEADYLRTELELSKLAAKDQAAVPLRSRLWEAWSAVDERWLMEFTQPSLLRANPTPFAAAWLNFDLDELRPVDGTYGRWAYKTLPDLPPEECLGDFGYMTGRRIRRPVSKRTRQLLEQLLDRATSHGLRLPDELFRFATEFKFPSVTDCFVTITEEEEPIRMHTDGTGFLRFFSDSQDCVVWELNLHTSGAHCVIARAARAWFVAPSFKAFVYRVWAENEIWFNLTESAPRGGRRPPKLTPTLQTYIDHYRNRRSRRRRA